MRFIVVPLSSSRISDVPGMRRPQNLWLVVDTIGHEVMDWSYHQDIAEEARDYFEEHPKQVP